MPKFIVGAGSYRDIGGNYLVVQPPIPDQYVESMERMTSGDVYHEKDRSIVICKQVLMDKSELLRRGAGVLRAAGYEVEIYMEMSVDEQERARSFVEKWQALSPVQQQLLTQEFPQSLWHNAQVVPEIDDL